MIDQLHSAAALPLPASVAKPISRTPLSKTVTSILTVGTRVAGGVHVLLAYHLAPSLTPASSSSGDQKESQR